MPGRRATLTVRSRSLRADLAIVVWSPPHARGPLPLLIVHDGPDYAEHAGLLGLVATAIERGDAPAHRVALLPAGVREEWYSASAAYARALSTELLPAIARAVAVSGPPAGVGASLGAVALLHAHRRHPPLFAGLLLQSGSFFVPRHDRHESGFARYGRLVRFVRAVRRAGPAPDPIPITLTCAAGEENIHNNREMACALALQGYPAALHETTGGHDYESWAMALEAHLAPLLATIWS